MNSREPQGQGRTKYILLAALAVAVIPAVLHFLPPPLQIEFNWGFPLGGGGFCAIRQRSRKPPTPPVTPLILGSPLKAGVPYRNHFAPRRWRRQTNDSHRDIVPKGPKTTLRAPPVRSNFGGAAGDGSIPACAGEPVCLAPDGRGLSPRVRGNHCVIGTGLSPRVRGNRRCVTAYAAAEIRSIPACAGEPFPISGTSSQTTSFGLSPRVRGNRGTGETVRCDKRQVYPRVCGGTASSRCGRKVYLRGGGTFGKPYKGRVYPRVCGGTRDTSVPDDLSGSARLPSARVYPRVCGGTVD